MAEAAGVVNDAGKANDAEFRDTLSSSSDDVRELGLAVRGLVFEVYPETVEVVWPRQGTTGWGIGPKKFTEQFAYLSVYKKHVTLGFYHGGELPDPDDLLPDTGGKQVSGSLSMRSLRITEPGQVDEPAVRDLIEAAVNHQKTLLAD